MARLERLNSTAPVKITTDPSTSQKVPFGAVAGATLMVTSGGGTIDWYCQASPDGPLFKMFNSDNTPCQSIVTAGNAFDLPGGLFACPFIVGGGATVEGILSVSS
jgi:hypothetical protein